MEKQEKIDMIVKLIDELVGSNKPFGDTNHDKQALENLEIKMAIADKLNNDIFQSIFDIDRHEQSIRENAQAVIDYIHNRYEADKETMLLFGEHVRK